MYDAVFFAIRFAQAAAVFIQQSSRPVIETDGYVPGWQNDGG